MIKSAHGTKKKLSSSFWTLVFQAWGGTWNGKREYSDLSRSSIRTTRMNVAKIAVPNVKAIATTLGLTVIVVVSALRRWVTVFSLEPQFVSVERLLLLNPVVDTLQGCASFRPLCVLLFCSNASADRSVLFSSSFNGVQILSSGWQTAPAGQQLSPVQLASPPQRSYTLFWHGEIVLSSSNWHSDQSSEMNLHVVKVGQQVLPWNPEPSHWSPAWFMHSRLETDVGLAPTTINKNANVLTRQSFCLWCCVWAPARWSLGIVISELYLAPLSIVPQFCNAQKNQRRQFRPLGLFQFAPSQLWALVRHSISGYWRDTPLARAIECPSVVQSHVQVPCVRLLLVPISRLLPMLSRANTFVIER